MTRENAQRAAAGLVFIGMVTVLLDPVMPWN